MKKIDYNPNSLSHHNENIQYWVTQGIVIDGERYSVEELFVRGNTLYGVISTNKIDFYEYPLATNVTQGTFDPSGILNRLDRLESIPQYKYDDTGINQKLDKIRAEFDDNKTKINTRVTMLENKPDKDNQELSISGYDLSISNGNTVTLPQPNLDVLNSFATKEYVNKLVKDSEYNPEPILTRLSLLESKPDKDTVYDDSEIIDRLSVLELKEDRDNQKLSINNDVLSISGGNSVKLPVTPSKEFIVRSSTNGVVVSSYEVNNTKTYEINIDTALDNFYKKSETYTQKEVQGLLEAQQNKATDITVYKGTFTDRYKVIEGDYDTAISPRITLTYSSSTGVGIVKIDFKILSNVYKGFIIGKLPNNSPVPAELVESQVWVGDTNTSVWIDKGSNVIKISRTDNPSIFNKRIILSIPGIFKLK